MKNSEIYNKLESAVKILIEVRKVEGNEECKEIIDEMWEITDELKTLRDAIPPWD